MEIKYTNSDFKDIESIIEGKSEILLEKKTYTLNKTLKITAPITISGNGATIDGNGIDIGLIITSSDVTLQDITFVNFKSAVEIDAEGGLQERVTVKNCAIPFNDIAIQAIQVGSSKSGGIMRDILIENNTITSASIWKEDELFLVLPINVAAATGRCGDTEPIKNCLLERVYVKNNKVLGANRLAINLMSAIGSEFNMLGFNAGYENVHIKDAHIVGNYVEQCWDGPFNIVGTFSYAKDATIDGLEIDGNEAGFGIAGIYMYACEPLFQSNSGNGIKNVKITNNKLFRAVKDVGEPTRGIFVAAARCDYYPNVSVCDSALENLEIYGNTMDGAGIVITGAYALLDGENTMENNVVKNISIHDNVIKNADYPFNFDGAQIEGRRYDWNFGYPRHDKRWLDDITDDTVTTNVMTNNRIENLVCENNIVDGYRFRIVASGANVRGHGVVKGNKVTKGIIFRNNKFNVGENHVKVYNVIEEDFIKDGGGNEVSKEFLKK